MDYAIIPDEEALGSCAWCKTSIAEDMEVVGVGVTFKPGMDFADYEGHCVEIRFVSVESPFHMMVTAQDSEAKQEGNDGVFLLCSEECGSRFAKALEKEISLGNLFQSIDF